MRSATESRPASRRFRRSIARGLSASIVIQLTLFSAGCGPGRTAEELIGSAELYSGRISFGWENLDCFQMRGRARLTGESLVANGPFVLWGSSAGLLRGDFYGPGGGPVLSVMADSTGLMAYMPDEGEAFFVEGLLPLGGGGIGPVDAVFLLRTGFPLRLAPWELLEGADPLPGEGLVRWTLSRGAPDSLLVVDLPYGAFFPRGVYWPGGELRVSSSSPHDEYRRWPWKWEMELMGTGVEMQLTSLDADAVPWEGIWSLAVPVPVDTLSAPPMWGPAWKVPQR